VARLALRAAARHLPVAHCTPGVRLRKTLHGSALAAGNEFDRRRPPQAAGYHRHSVEMLPVGSRRKRRVSPNWQ